MIQIEPSRAGWLARVEINGAPVLLMLDTGSTVTALDGKRLGIERAGRDATTLIGSGRERRAVLKPVELILGGDLALRQDLETVDVDVTHMRKDCRCDVAGFLGMNVLGQFDAFTVDFEARTLTLRRKGS